MKITIHCEDDMVQAHTSSPIQLPDFIRIMNTAILAGMNTFLNSIPEENKEQMKHEIFDMYNYSASNVLATFDPEGELHPGLSTKAILKAENELMAEEVRKHDCP